MCCKMQPKIEITGCLYAAAQAGKPPQVYVHDSDNAAVADIAYRAVYAKVTNKTVCSGNHLM